MFDKDQLWPGMAKVWKIIVEIILKTIAVEMILVWFNL